MTLASLRRADVVFFLSRPAADSLVNRTRANTNLLPMSPPNPAMLSAAGSALSPVPTADGPFFAFVGDIMRHKRVEDVVSATLLLESRGVEVRLVVCGNVVDPDYAAEVQEMAESSPGKVIIFLGGTGYIETLALMRASIGTIASSEVENPGRVPTEAMSVGTPLISTRIPSSQDACGDSPIYYEPGDIDALAAAMLSVLQDKEIRKGMVRRGRKKLSTLDHLTATREILTAMELL